MVPEQATGLLLYLAGVPDPRDRRGLRHELVGVLAVAVCAVLAGARSFTAIGEWAADAPARVLRSLNMRPDPLTGLVTAPDEATVRRVLTAIDADALDAAVGAWLQDLAPVASAARVSRVAWNFGDDPCELYAAVPTVSGRWAASGWVCRCSAVTS